MKDDKGFDIVNHKFSDREYLKKLKIIGNNFLVFRFTEYIPFIKVSKKDAIALARHFKLTEGDLK